MDRSYSRRDNAKANARPIAWLAGLVAALTTLAAPAHGADRGETLAFCNVRVFDGARVIPSATVIVAGGAIVRVGPGVEVTRDARVIDGTGKTLLPGLMDSHAHTVDETQLHKAAVFGVTTVLDMMSDPGFAARMRAGQGQGQAAASASAQGRADLFSAGAAVLPGGASGAHSTGKLPTIDGPGQAQAFVDARIAEGSDYIKVLCGDGEQLGLPGGPTLSRETIAAVISAAHARKKLAVAHVLELEDARGAVADGIDGLVHLFVDAPGDDAFYRLAAAKRPFVVPTLTVLEGILGHPSGAAVAGDPALAPFLLAEDVRILKGHADSLGPKPRATSTNTNTNKGRPLPRETVIGLKAIGVPILAGTDAPSSGVAYGASLHRELELLVAMGLSPVEALSAATAMPARAFGLADRGRIARGLRADLVLVDGDPTADIRATRRIAGVWKAGRPIDRSAWRERVAREARGIADAASSQPPPPSGSESGLVSDFDDGQVRSVFGSGWVVSSDSMLGGKSTATFEVAQGGARGSQGALLIRGRIDDRPQPRWAGARFLPGRSMLEPANLSARKVVSFWARGDGKRYSILLFTRKRGFSPSGRSFVAGREWSQHRFELKQFHGTDGSDILGVFLGGGPEVGEFELCIDDVRFE